MQKRAGAKARPAGLTLVEALVVMAVLGVILSLSAPTLVGLHQQHLLQAQAEGLLGSLQLARSEALRRQLRVTVCARAQSVGCDGAGRWPQGWLVFADANNNAQFDADEALIEVHAPLPSSVRMGVTGTVPAYFSYDALGRSATVRGAFMAATWRFCLSGESGSWQVVSNALGRPRLEKTASAVCAPQLSELHPPGS
jgi:type IV fimbrial biogenesis protein FimT